MKKIGHLQSHSAYRSLLFLKHSGTLSSPFLLRFTARHPREALLWRSSGGKGSDQRIPALRGFLLPS